MATDDSRARGARSRTIQEIAADGMELPLVKARTEAARARERVEAAKKAAAPLGSWADDLRGCPNAVLRSSLFCAGKPPAERVFYREYKLASSLAPYEVWYTGPRLYQPDLDVWLELVHRCRRLSLGTSVDCPMRPTLRALGRPIGKSGRDWLTGTFTLLRATGIHVRWKDAKTGEHRGYIRGLVDALDYDRDGKCWSVRLDPEIVALFAPDEHTWVHLDTRLQLGKSYLAKWLHGYFSSHRKPLPVSVERLRSLSGSQGEVRFFRRRLRQAMDEVAFAERSRRANFDWHIDAADLVHVRRESGHQDEPVVGGDVDGMLVAASPLCGLPLLPRRENECGDTRHTGHRRHAAAPRPVQGNGRPSRGGLEGTRLHTPGHRRHSRGALNARTQGIEGTVTGHRR